MPDLNFGDIVETNYVYSQRAIDRREYGQSQIKANGNPAVYHAGDTVHLPFASGETSTIFAMGQAWLANQSGVGPG
jgi:hypothetical protein